MKLSFRISFFQPIIQLIDSTLYYTANVLAVSSNANENVYQCIQIVDPLNLVDFRKDVNIY